MPPIEISDDKQKLDRALVHTFLSTQANWCKGISAATVNKSIEHSLCIGAYQLNQQIGFARVISDFATFANLVDVFVLPSHRGQGIARLLMHAVMQHEQLQNLRRFTLATSDKQDMYAKFGFTPLAKPHSFMERYDAQVYSR